MRLMQLLRHGGKHVALRQLIPSLSDAYGVSCRARAERVALRRTMAVIRPRPDGTGHWVPRSPLSFSGDSAGQFAETVANLPRRKIHNPAHASFQAVSALPHDVVVVPLEDGSGERSHGVHPGLCRAYVPLVGHGCHATVMEEPPAARAGQFAHGTA